MTGDLWTAEDAAAATGGTAHGHWAATGVSIDSRTVGAGDLFVALRGPNFDGHDYVGAAMEAGAAAAMVETGRAGGANAVEVADTFDGLNALGAAGRARMGGRVIAITGSVGKTGTKEAMRHALATQAPTYATEGNLNNHWGAPLTLARMPADTAFGVIELGMNHPGELTPLSKLVRPHVALITWVAAAHVEFFSSVAEVAEAKAEVFAGAAGGVAVLPRDNDHYDLLAERADEAGCARIIPFGGHHLAEARLLSSMMEADRSLVSAEIEGERINYTLALPGHHNVVNSLGLLAAAAAAGADLEKTAAALETLSPVKGRGARHDIAVDGGRITVIDESYNASPAAMRAAFETLMLANPAAGGRRIAVLGDMRELGDEADQLHAELAGPLLDAGVDLLLCAGPHMAALYDAVPEDRRGGHAPDSDALLPQVLAAVAAGDVVCVKGSLGSRMAPIVDALIGNSREATA